VRISRETGHQDKSLAIAGMVEVMKLNTVYLGKFIHF